MNVKYILKQGSDMVRLFREDYSMNLSEMEGSKSGSKEKIGTLLKKGQIAPEQW